MNKIGIDFGTSFSTASWINPRTNQPEAITFHDIGLQKMPSVVYYGSEEVMVGLAAYNQLENSTGMEAEHRKRILQSMVMSIKRNMQKGQFYYLPSGERKSHEEIIAAILQKIKEQSEITCFNSQSIEEATITHPVVFASWQKEMLRNAASIAGFKNIQLLEEPVAAALGYAATKNKNIKNVLVYDFGGGTFDVAFVQCDEDGQFRVPIDPEGDAYCGGDDIDDAIYDHWEKITKEQYNRTIDSNPNNRDIGFKARCRKHKEQMSLFPKNQFSEVLPPPGFNRVEMELERNEFDHIVEPIIDKTISRTERLLQKVEDAGYTIDTAIMIGGSSRIPVVYDKLKTILPVDPERVMQVDVAVALGAVIFNSNIKSVADKYCMYCGGGEKEQKQSVSNKFCHFCGKKDWYC
jgi:molecular chaperone DnaK